MRPLVIVALAAVLGASVSAQSAPTDQAILDELRQIRQLLERLTSPRAPAPGPEGPERVQLSTTTGYMIGSPDAPLTMVEFTDLQCPFCRQFHATTFERLKADYIDTHKLRYFTRDFPLEELHPFATVAARAARCAGDQGKFWEMRHAILVTPAAPAKESFFKQAETLKLDPLRFDTCLADGDRFQKEIREDMRDGVRAGITGTPSFVIGRTSGDALDGVLVLGAQPYEAFDAQLKALLGEEAAR
jgi:protein-disulfide isomerase